MFLLTNGKYSLAERFENELLKNGFTQEQLGLFPGKWAKEWAKENYTVEELKLLYDDLVYIEEYLSNPDFLSVVSLTIKTHRMSLMIFSEWLIKAVSNLKKITKENLQQFLEYRTANEVSTSTVNKDFKTIKNFCYWADKEEVIEGIKLPQMDKSEKNRPPETLTKNEIDEMLCDVENNGNLRDIAIISVLLYTGVRVKELQMLNRDEVVIFDHKGYLYICGGQGRKERNIPLNKKARNALNRYLKIRRDGKEALFLSNKPGNERISIRTIQKIVKEYGSNPQKLRDTFITSLVRSNNNLMLVASLTGHDSIEMLNRYVQFTNKFENREAAVENIYNY